MEGGAAAPRASQVGLGVPQAPQFCVAPDTYNLGVIRHDSRTTRRDDIQQSLYTIGGL